MNALLLLHAASTLFMAGLIWFVQCVHYPLFARVGDAEFRPYHAAHTSRTTTIVLPTMLIEVTCAIGLWVRLPEPAQRGWATLGLVLLGLIWGATALLQIPAHRALSRGFDRVQHRRLVLSNWIRTIGWSLRALIAIGLLGAALD